MSGRKDSIAIVHSPSTKLVRKSRVTSNEILTRRWSEALVKPVHHRLADETRNRRGVSGSRHLLHLHIGGR